MFSENINVNGGPKKNGSLKEAKRPFGKGWSRPHPTRLDSLSHEGSSYVPSSIVSILSRLSKFFPIQNVITSSNEPLVH